MSMQDRQYYIYIMTNETNTVSYTGFTNDLKRRVFEHKERFIKDFTSRYRINKLVYYELTGDVNSAIAREKQLKAGNRKKKVDLIKGMNPSWKDLYDEI